MFFDELNRIDRSMSNVRFTRTNRIAYMRDLESDEEKGINPGVISQNQEREYRRVFEPGLSDGNRHVNAARYRRILRKK